MTGELDARDRMHIKFCPDAWCKIEGPAGESCKLLDHLLDRVEEEALHREGRRLDAAFHGLPPRAQRTLGPGLLHAIDEVDPYEKVDAFDPELDEVHPGEKSDCPDCRAGVEHWHRKADGEPVAANP